MAADYYKHTCGHRSLKSERGKGEVSEIRSDCYECRCKRVGQTIAFLRFGTAPESGTSTNYRDRTSEEGISVYEIVNGKADLVGWFFDFLSRPAYRGQGVITGWGSDGEPLVEVKSIRRIWKSEVAKLGAGPDRG